MGLFMKLLIYLKSVVPRNADGPVLAVCQFVITSPRHFVNTSLRHYAITSLRQHVITSARHSVNTSVLHYIITRQYVRTSCPARKCAPLICSKCAHRSHYVVTSLRQHVITPLSLRHYVIIINSIYY